MEYFIYGLGGGGSYFLEDDQWTGPAVGISGGLQASEPLSFELTIQHVPVDGDSYYFALLGARYSFIETDFFMEPSIDFHTGILVPMGEKSDTDGVLGVGAGLLYRTHHGIEFGPRLESTLVFAGSHKGVMLSWTGVVGYRF